MSPSETRTPPSRESLSIANLRAILVLAVLAVHAQLAYLNFLPQHAYAFDAPPYRWLSVPVVDHARLLGFDIYCAWADIFVMSLFFLVSGLFVWPSLERKGVRKFAIQRTVRLGIPFALGVLLLMPLAYYPVYAQTGANPGIADFLKHWMKLPFWPNGPLWFLWLLLAADLAVAALHAGGAKLRDAVQRLSQRAAARPYALLVCLLFASALGYVPLAARFGPLPWIEFGPFSVQLSRPGLYVAYFAAGIILGTAGVGRGLIADNGPLTLRWGQWLLAAVVCFGLWLAVSSKAMIGSATLPWTIADAFCFVLVCFSTGFCALALAFRFAGFTNTWLQSLQANSYGIYVVHYVFVVWLQFALLGVSLPAIAKFVVVYAGTVGLSWLVTALFRHAAAVAATLFYAPGNPVAKGPRPAGANSPP